MSNKRAKIEPMEKRATRSSGLLAPTASTSAPVPPVAVASRSPDSDINMDADDEEAFEYDSHCEEPTEKPSEDEKEEEREGGNEVEEVGMLELSSDEETAARSEKRVNVIIIDDSEDNNSDAAQPPPEVPQKKGKITSRKQFQLDVEGLVSQYATFQGGIVRGKTT